jgi:hypothetical protein
MLKEFLGYNQAQLNTLGFAKDLGTYVAVLQGLAVDVIPVWGFLALGSIQSFVGYGVLWLVLSGRIAPPPYWMVLISLSKRFMFLNYFSWKKKKPTQSSSGLFVVVADLKPNSPHPIVFETLSCMGAIRVIRRVTRRKICKISLRIGFLCLC